MNIQLLKQKFSALVDALESVEEEKQSLEQSLLKAEERNLILQSELQLSQSLLEETKARSSEKVASLESSIESYKAEVQRHIQLYQEKLERRNLAVLEMKHINEALFKELYQVRNENEYLKISLQQAKDILMRSAETQRDLVSLVSHHENTRVS
jgi:Mg2+ and Co2+ transporter CorA